MKKPTHDDTGAAADPTIAKLNAVIYRAFPPKWDGHGWLYGELYYLGDSGCTLPGFYPHSWMLDGMTPVGPDCVFRILRHRGEDTTEFENHLAQLAEQAATRSATREVLRSSARAKLTPEEISACGLSKETFATMCFPNCQP